MDHFWNEKWSDHFFWNGDSYWFCTVYGCEKTVCMSSSLSRRVDNSYGIADRLEYLFAIAYSLWTASHHFLFFSRKCFIFSILLFLLFFPCILFLFFLSFFHIFCFPYSTCRRSLHQARTTSIAADLSSSSIPSTWRNLLIPSQNFHLPSNRFCSWFVPLLMYMPVGSCR